MSSAIPAVVAACSMISSSQQSRRRQQSVVVQQHQHQQQLPTMVPPLPPPQPPLSAFKQQKVEVEEIGSGGGGDGETVELVLQSRISGGDDDDDDLKKRIATLEQALERLETGQVSLESQIHAEPLHNHLTIQMMGRSLLSTAAASASGCWSKNIFKEKNKKEKGKQPQRNEKTGGGGPRLPKSTASSSIKPSSPPEASNNSSCCSCSDVRLVYAGLLVTALVFAFFVLVGQAYAGSGGDVAGKLLLALFYSIAFCLPVYVGLAVFGDAKCLHGYIFRKNSEFEYSRAKSNNRAVVWCKALWVTIIYTAVIYFAAAVVCGVLALFVGLFAGAVLSLQKLAAATANSTKAT